VRGVLGARQAGLDQREPSLHEHDEEARHHRPDDVEGGLRVGEVLRQFRDGGIRHEVSVTASEPSRFAGSMGRERRCVQQGSEAARRALCKRHSATRRSMSP
jgi:hypothetical protein